MFGAACTADVGDRGEPFSNGDDVDAGGLDREASPLYDAGGVVIRGECTATCAAGKERCHADAARTYDRCISGSFDPGLRSACWSNFQSSERGCENRCARFDSCGDSDFEMEIDPASGSSALTNACLAWDRSESCFDTTNSYGVTYDGTDYCPQFGLVEDPAFTSFYECMYESGACVADCGAPTDDVFGTQEVCDDLQACGQGCIGEQEDFLMHNLAWLRHDVRAALDACMALSCGEGRVLCFREWTRAVTHYSVRPRSY